MAESVFAHRLREEGLSDQVKVDSAGTGNWHIGSDPHFGTQDVLERNGTEWNHKARTFEKSDHDRFDLILAMDEDNFRVIKSRGKGKAEVRKLLEFAPACGYDDVPDPYPDGDFDETFELVSQASNGLIVWVKQKLAAK
jgi:protein-tyrosine phosphatase